MTLVMLELVMLTAVLGGIETRRQMRRVLDEHHAAARELSRRDAQLAEAHAEVREARAAGDGRFSGLALGPFRLGLLLGRGAMGEVYDALGPGDAPCAVKVLAANLLDNQDALTRFQREARAIQAIDHPNIVEMIDVSPESSAQPYLAMERAPRGAALLALSRDRERRASGLG